MRGRIRARACVGWSGRVRVGWIGDHHHDDAAQTSSIGIDEVDGRRRHARTHTHAHSAGLGCGLLPFIRDQAHERQSEPRAMRLDVRIVIAGDDDVGKSTLITSLIKEEFVARVQPVVPEITLPPEVAPEGVVTKIVDTSCECGRGAQRSSKVKRVIGCRCARSHVSFFLFFSPVRSRTRATTAS